jgi:hypothetical protein
MSCKGAYAHITSFLALEQQVLPRAPVEPVAIRFAAGEAVDLPLGSVFTLLRPVVSHLSVQRLPLRCRPGKVYSFTLEITTQRDLPPSQRRAAVESVVTHTTAAAVFDAFAASSCTRVPEITVCPAEDLNGVVLHIAIPPDAPLGSSLRISSVSFAGEVLESPALPATVSVVRPGIVAPAVLKGAANRWTTTPAISSEGVLYVPLNGNGAVKAYDQDGAALPCEAILTKPAGLSTSTRTAAVDDESHSLILCDVKSKHSQVVCLDLPSKGIRWSTQGACSFNNCYGGAALWRRGVFFVANYGAGCLDVLRVSDGIKVASAAVVAECVAADAASSTVFTSTTGETVSSFQWDGTTLTQLADLPLPGKRRSYIPLAVVPAAAGPGSPASSYLVVGNAAGGVLNVYALPERRHVYDYTVLSGVSSRHSGSGKVEANIVGLAADPSGVALVACDKLSEDIHVLPWPLPGMPTAGRAPATNARRKSCSRS